MGPNEYEFFCKGEKQGSYTMTLENGQDDEWDEIMSAAAYIARENHGAPVDIVNQGILIRTV